MTDEPNEPNEPNITDVTDGSVDYEVGYGRPPAHSRFRPGVSGNPGGRPKGRKNLRTMFLAVLNETVTVTENGRTRQMTKGEAAVRQQVNRGLTGDPRAVRETLRMLDNFEQRPEEAEDESTAETDLAVMKSMLRRMQNAASVPDTDNNNITEQETTT